MKHLCYDTATPERVVVSHKEDDDTTLWPTNGVGAAIDRARNLLEIGEDVVLFLPVGTWSAAMVSSILMSWQKQLCVVQWSSAPA